MKKIGLTLLMTLALVATAVLTSASAASPPFTAAQQTCERFIGGTFLVGGTEPTGLPTIYKCIGPNVDGSQPGVIRAFVALCIHAYGGGAVTNVGANEEGGPGLFCLRQGV